MRQKIGIFSKICVMATAACMCFAFNSYAATKTKQTKSNTSTKPVVVNNKTSQFDEVFSDLGAKTADTTSADLAERVRQQRALLDGKGNSQSVAKASGVTGANACDATLRKCMAEKCGSDFTKCAKDSTAIWGDKMDSCRRKTQCTGHEYSLLAPEILADRDFNERMSYYNSVISCGNRYNSCIFAECGTMLEKCLSKSDGDRAVSKCAPVAKDCKEQDSGMAARVMSVFGDLRTFATAQAEKDEKRLYELRDLMRNQCNRLGAVFDERTLDCVYTVNFFAGDNTSTPTSSKKLYAGDSFQCNANWFGIDVTTFKENAYRRTRAQTSASSAMMGAGVGVAAGLLSSGAIDRALDTQRAEKAAKEECEKSGFTWEKGTCNKDKPYEGSQNQGKGEQNQGESEQQEDVCPPNQHLDDSGNCVEESGIDCAPICKDILDDLQTNINNGDYLYKATLNEPSCKEECRTEIGSLCATLEDKKYDGKKINKSYLVFNGNNFYCDFQTSDSSYAFQTTSVNNAVNNALQCSMYNNNESGCNKLGKCEWKDDKCQDKATPPETSTPNDTGTADDTSPVDINITVITSAKTPVTGTLTCKTKKAQSKKTDKNGLVALKKIPANTQCTISTRTPTCSPQTITAQELSTMTSITLKCDKVDRCINNGGKWQNNTCLGANVTATNSCEPTPEAICGQGQQYSKCKWNGQSCVPKKK